MNKSHHLSCKYSLQDTQKQKPDQDFNNSSPVQKLLIMFRPGSHLFHPALMPGGTSIPVAAGPRPGIRQIVYPAMLGVPYYVSPYTPIFRPAFVPRVVLQSMPQVIQPQITNTNDFVPSITPTRLPQNKVFVWKIASTVENDFILALLQLCGPVKSWNRPEDLKSGKPKGFGLCEFESAEGVLRAFRLLNELNIDGQELLINASQATMEYLESYVNKKAECFKKIKEAEAAESEKEGDVKPSSEKSELPMFSDEVSEKGDKQEERGKKFDTNNFGIVSDEDRKADLETMEQLTFMIKLRLKSSLSLSPPLQDADGSNSLNSEQLVESEGEKKRDKKRARKPKPSSYQDTSEKSSPERDRKKERKRRERERERDKSDEVRYEGEEETEHARRERKYDEADERAYKARVEAWEDREQRKKYKRKKERERKYDREQQILEEEMESDDGDSRKSRRWIKSERKRRKREKEKDLIDRIKEEEELAEAEITERDISKESNLADYHHIGTTFASDTLNNDTEEDVNVCTDMEMEPLSPIHNSIEEELAEAEIGEGEITKESTWEDHHHIGTTVASDTLNNDNEEDVDICTDMETGPLSPIHNSIEELQAIQSSPPGTPISNFDAAAEFANQISGDTSKEEEPIVDGERRNDNEKTRYIQKLLELLDSIPETKEELFSYNINWDVCDKNKLHDKMRPWISEKVVEFLGAEEPTLVDYIVSSTQEHIKASEMLDRLECILDDEAEMFVLEMWKILIFESQKIETGVSIEAGS